MDFRVAQAATPGEAGPFTRKAPGYPCCPDTMAWTLPGSPKRVDEDSLNQEDAVQKEGVYGGNTQGARPVGESRIFERETKRGSWCLNGC